MLPPEPEILEGRLPFSAAQAALDGTVQRAITDYHSCGWYGTKMHPDRGCYAIVNQAGPLTDLIGDRLRVIHGLRSTIVYVFASADVPWDIAITRRSFAAIELLTIPSLDVRFEVLAG